MTSPKFVATACLHFQPPIDSPGCVTHKTLPLDGSETVSQVYDWVKTKTDAYTICFLLRIDQADAIIKPDAK